MAQNLIDTTFTGKDITTAVSVYEYTAAAIGYLGFQVRLAAVAGGGDYLCWLTLNDGDAQGDNIVTPKITYTAGAGETAFWFANLAVDVLPGDVVNVFVKGLAGDTNEAGSIRIFADNYAVAADVPTADIAAIKAKTDNLPTDPADESLLEAAITAAASPLATSAAVSAVSSNVTAIKAKTDNLPTDPADESNILGAIAAIPTETATVPFMPNRVVDSVGEPIAEVDTWVNTNNTDSTIGIQARAYTNALGLIDASFNLVPGVYYVWRQHDFYSFSNPETVTVS